MSVVWRRCSFSFVIVAPILHKAQLLKLTQDMYVSVKGWGSLSKGQCGICVGCAELGLLL